MAVGRDVPLVPDRTRWVPIRGTQMLQDADPIGPAEREALDLAGRLRGATVAGMIVFQVGLLLTLGSLYQATNASRNALRGLGGRTDLLVPTNGTLLTPGLGFGLALGGVAAIGVPAAWFLRAWLLRRARDGGFHAWTLGRTLDPDGTLPVEARWRAIVGHEVATGGARPESVVRWTRTLGAPPEAALRPFVVALREHLKDGEALAQQAMVSAPGGGTSEVAFGGRTYEAAELCGLCRTALEHVREVLVRMP